MDLEWGSVAISQETPSSARNSCIKLSSVEPCVNRVVSHLDILKRHIQQCRRLRQPEPLTLAQKSVVLDVRSKHAVKSSLMVEGVTTGTLVDRTQKHDKAIPQDGYNVINNAMKLVVRLAQDKQETLESLVEEKVRVKALGQSLDRECERRLNLLPSAVQAEHDELLRDLIELRWHVNFDRRQLERVKDDLRLTKLRNDRLKQSVGYYKENCPLLDEKLVIENDHMSGIAQDQQETLDRLNQAKHALAQTEDKSNRAHKRVSREREDIENTLDECRTTLLISETKLKDALAEINSLAHQMNDCQAKISVNRREMKNLDDKMDTTRGYLSQVESRVSVLKQSCSAVEEQHRSLGERLKRLQQTKQSKHGHLEAEHVLVMADMQQEDHKLREARDSNEDLKQSIDTLKENIALFNKQTQDDEKSVERARRELVKLDEQMGVSVAQFTKVREEHVYLSDQLKTDEAKAGDVEHSMRTKLDALKQQIKDESRTKIMYDGKVQASSAELDKLKAECKQQATKAERLALQSQKQSQGQTDVVGKLEEEHQSMADTLDSVKSQLSSVKSEHSVIERELIEKISVLTPEEKHLSEEMQSKISRVETVSERISTLQRKIEDTVKSTAMLDKMEASTNATIDQLQSQLGVLRNRLTAEKEEEQRCREEYKEIFDFSSDADEKHAKYFEKRLNLLKQCKVDLFQAHSTNSTLADEYRRLQYEFISAKTIALRVLEKKLEMEESLRDQKQLLAFQACIQSAMKAYYEHRGTQGWKDVTHFYRESKYNGQCLKLLQQQFRTVIELMHEFLENNPA